MKVNGNFNFFIVDPAQVHGCDGGNVFNFLLEVLGIVLKLVRGEFSRQIDVHNGLKLRDVQFKNIGVGGQVLGEVGRGLNRINLVFDLAKGFVYAYLEVKADFDGRKTLHRSGLDFVYTADGVELLLERTGNQALHVYGRIARVGCSDKNGGLHHFGEALCRHGSVGKKTRNSNDYG